MKLIKPSVVLLSAVTTLQRALLVFVHPGHCLLLTASDTFFSHLTCSLQTRCCEGSGTALIGQHGRRKNRTTARGSNGCKNVAARASRKFIYFEVYFQNELGHKAFRYGFASEMQRMFIAE